LRSDSRELFTGSAPNTHHLDFNSQVPSFCPVLSTLAVSAALICPVHTHSRQRNLFKFDIECQLCGPSSAIHVKCSPTADDFRITTQGCCGHFFVGRINPADGRSASLFLTNPRMEENASYPEMHPLRVIARILLRSGRLSSTQRFLLQWLVPGHLPSRSGISRRAKTASLEAIIQAMHGNFSIRTSPGSDPERLSYAGQEVVTFTWLGSWALEVLRRAQYLELDCSFRAIKPYVYCIPEAIIANVGIPLGLVIAPSERMDVFSMFADLLFTQGFAPEELQRIPLLSDEGAALKKYARRYHLWHFLCYRHLLECLGSGTVVALLALRLLFTTTEVQFSECIEQTLSDFAIGCRAEAITENARQKFMEIFGITESPDGKLALDIDVFRRQALWGDRGIAFGVAPCSNHVEGMHGRLNEKTHRIRSLPARVEKVTKAIIKSAGTWAIKVARGQRKARAALLKSAKDHGYAYESCPFGEMCDRGEILSRRLEMQVPCAHAIAQICASRSIEVQPCPQFPLYDLELPQISVSPYNGEWMLKKKRLTETRAWPMIEESRIAIVEFSHADADCRLIHRIRRELRAFNRGAEFRYSMDQMLVKLGRIRGRLEVERAGMRSFAQIHLESNSVFLIECLKVVKTGEPWE
jgi:hypothetical protein